MKHITDQEITRYYAGELSRQEERELLSHIAGCTSCAERLAVAFPESELLSPPPEMKNQILTASRKVTAKTVSLSSRQRTEFYRYSAKVVLAMGMSLLLLFAGNLFGQGILPEGNGSTSSIIERQSGEYAAETGEYIVKDKKEKKQYRAAQNKIASAIRASSVKVNETLGKWAGEMNEKLAR